MRIYGVLTEPGEKTMIFSLFGSNTGSSHSWVIVQVNLTSVFSKTFFLPLALKMRSALTWWFGWHCIDIVKEFVPNSSLRCVYQHRIPLDSEPSLSVSVLVLISISNNVNVPLDRYRYHGGHRSPCKVVWMNQNKHYHGLSEPSPRSQTIDIAIMA